MNQIEVTGTLVSADVGCKEFLLQLPHTTVPLTCQLADGVWEDQFLLGTRICVSGSFASRDLCKPNPCDCQTVTNVIESYVKVTGITEVQMTHNHVSISGSLVKAPRLVNAPSKSFYSSRIRLDDGAGFATVTTAEPPDERQTLTISGCLQAKDYKRYLECPCCGKSWKLPLLSVCLREIKTRETLVHIRNL